MCSIYAGVTILLLLPCISAEIFGRHARTGQTKHDQVTSINISYTTKYFVQPVDHFGFANKDEYKMRYLINDEHWKPGGPIFFYCGNEGDITWFCNNTGIMWEWAPEFGAMLVFGEHRYYGTSMPYGKQSYKDISHLGYLTSEQALADFARLLEYIKGSVKGAENSKVIAFGGSYGGMLATWFRMKYPHVAHGSLAASAPIWMFGDLTPCDTFFKTVTKDFAESGENCVTNINSSWSVMDKYGNTDMGRKLLTETFKLCRPVNNSKDVQDLKDWFSNVYGNLAMVDYPYPTNFLEPLPGWPIKEFCKHLAHKELKGEALLANLAAAAGVYFNYTGDKKCLNVKQQAVKAAGDRGWDFQACSEMVMPLCSTGREDMFESIPWNLTQFSADCKKRYGVIARPNWALTVYGGKNISSLTNIIFSNGALDPWSGGGVLHEVSPSLHTVFIPSGAHHIDLRASNPSDPADVTEARDKEKKIIQSWLQEDEVTWGWFSGDSCWYNENYFLRIFALDLGMMTGLLIGLCLFQWITNSKFALIKKGRLPLMIEFDLVKRKVDCRNIHYSKVKVANLDIQKSAFIA